ncbi:MAG: ornithine cyclodeaminase family protein [Armatimonadota bacterium]
MGEKLRYLSRDDVISLDISMQEVIEAVEEGFRRKGMGQTQMPPKIAIHPRGEGTFLHAMPAYVGGIDAAAVKWVGGADDNPDRGLPTISGLIIYNDPETMFPRCIMDCQWVTAMRTGAANAVAMKYLGPEEPEVVAVVGCGVQGRSNTLAMATLYSSIRQLRCYDVSYEAVHEYAEQTLEKYDFEVVVADGPEDAVSEADIVVTAGPSPREPTPYLRDEWLKPGAMAAPVDYMGAWEGRLAQNVDKLITDDHAQMEYYRQKGYFNNVPKPYADLGQIVAGTYPGRESSEERTMSICMGIAVDDAVTAKLVYQAAVEQDCGTILPL